MDAMLVTAHLAGGFAASDPWSPALDGILAYWLLREQLGEEEFALGMTGHRPLTDAGLPLDRCEDGAGHWWWACSSPIYQQQAEYLRWYHRRFDTREAERFTAARRVVTSAGPYKNYRNAWTVHLAPTVSWHALGDRAETERLLRRCAAIGGGRGQGLGRVSRWEVTLDGDAESARHHRPLPAAYAAQRGIEGMVMEYGLRPPGRAAERVLCVLPL